jgi:hypothetical protein
MTQSPRIAQADGPDRHARAAAPRRSVWNDRDADTILDHATHCVEAAEANPQLQ